MRTPCPDLITLELARLVDNGTEWAKRFKRYDMLLDAGLSCEEAARLVTSPEHDLKLEQVAA